MDEVALVRRLRAALPDAIAIWLFGSFATGEAGPESDLDLAVLVAGRADPVALWRLAGELAEIAGRHVDLVDMRAASTVMQHQVVTNGRRLWARDVSAGLFEAFVLSEKTNLDEARAGLLQDIAREGVIHGR